MLRNVTTVLAALLIAVAPSARAQSSRPQFEVASVKPNKSGVGGVALDAAHGEFLASNMTLRTLLRYAFDRQLPEDERGRGSVLFSGSAGIQVVGGPAWITSDRFDVEGKPPDGHLPKQPEMQLMMQSLLEDRFQLKAHYESREVPVYHLVLIKSGKMKLSEDQSSGATDDKRTIGGIPLRRGGSTIATLGKPQPGSARVFHMVGNAIPTSEVVQMIQGWVDRPVIDQTNLKGLFDVEAQFSPAAASPTNPDPVGPSIFTAIQQDLGLKLESSKGPVDVLVIDSVSKPTEN
jgi:uncharacterized protein (TIGR03435 family)